MEAARWRMVVNNSAFLCYAKMLVAVIRRTILVEPFGLAYL